MRVGQGGMCEMSSKPTASESAPQSLLGDLGREELGQRAEGPWRSPAVSYVVAALGYFLMC